MKKDESAPQLQYMPLGLQKSPGLGQKNSSGYKSGALPPPEERLITQVGSQGDSIDNQSFRLKKDPSKFKDFDKAYIATVEKMYKEQGHQVSGLLTDDELVKLEHHKGLNENDFIERSYRFAQMKEDKIL